MLAEACDQAGLEALVPFDETVHAGTTPQTIYDANMKLLRSAQGVVANLCPFRGSEPDSGTVFEVGVAVMLGLPVAAYGVPSGSYGDRVTAKLDADGVLRDEDGLIVENYGLPLNLMLARSVHIAPTFRLALRHIAKQLAQP